MKKTLLLLPILILILIGASGKRIASYIYYKYVGNKIEKKALQYQDELRRTKKRIYEISRNLEGVSIPSWGKLEELALRYDFSGFILIKDINGVPIRWYGKVKDFNFQEGFRASFSTEGPFLKLCQDFSFGKVIISSPVPELENSIFIDRVNFFPSQYFFPLPDTLKPPAYSFLYKEEGPPLLRITFEAIPLEDFQLLFFKFYKSVLGIYLIILLLIFRFNLILKLIFLRFFLYLISFDFLPYLKEFSKREIFSLNLPFFESPLQLIITFIILIFIILNLKLKLNFKISLILFPLSALLYLFILKEFISYSNLFLSPFIFRVSLLFFASFFVLFWIKFLEFKNLKILAIFLIPLLFFFNSYYAFLFLIPGSAGVLSFRQKRFSFFLILALWALIPPYIFQRDFLKRYLENSYSYIKINQTTFSILKVQNTFPEILKDYDWEKELPLFDLIEDKKGLIEVLENKFSLKDLPLDYKFELFEGDEILSLSQSRGFPECSGLEREGFVQEGESYYHFSNPLNYRGKKWGRVLLHLYFYPPYMGKREIIPAGIGIYDRNRELQNSNAIFLPEKLEEKNLKQGIWHIYQEGEKYYLFLIPPWEFPFPDLLFGLLVFAGALASFPFPLRYKSISFLVLFPLLSVLFFVIFLGFLFTTDQRLSLIKLQNIYGSSIQKNMLDYVSGFSPTFYYKNGILSGGEVFEERFIYCPSKVMKKLPLKKPEVFEIDGDFYLFFEDRDGNLMAFKQPNLLGIDKPVQWLAEKTWGNIIFFYGIFLFLLTLILNKILEPVKKLSEMAVRAGKGEKFYEVKPVFGEEIEELSKALKNSFLKLQEEEKTLKETLNNLPVGVALFEGERNVLSNHLLPLGDEEILNLEEEGILERGERIFQYKKVKIDERKWIFFLNDITSEIEGEKLSVVSNIARIVAHEIKNPLTPIKLSIQYLKEIFSKKREEFNKEFLKISEEVLDSINDLEEISSEFSDFTRLPSLKKEKVNINKFFYNWLFPFISQEKIKLNLPEEDIIINLDTRLFKRAILNILNNAWQSKDPPPVVHLNLLKKEELIIEIIDEGPGVEEGLLEKIFEPYFTTKSMGTGLGLFISKKIIEEHKGKIKAENCPGGGLKITISLPYH